MVDNMDLERKLLGVYIEADCGADSQVQVLTKQDRPFYELGKICSIEYMKQPLTVFSSPELKNIRKKVFGEQCRIASEAWYEKNEDMFMDAVMKGKDTHEEKLVELMDNIKSAYFTSLTDFTLGFYEGASKKTYELTTDMFAKNVEIFNSFWKTFGFNMPNANNYAGKFINMLEEHNLNGMIRLYHEHPDEINKEYKGAKKFMAFIESKIKK